jgi:microcystin-dependent protein
MDLINFVQAGGFPVKAERLQEMQTAYSVFNDLGNLAGNLSIISGCIVSGTSVSDGSVFIDGEVLKFKGGFISSNVIIIEDVSSKEFENGEIKAVHYERYATFGTSDISWLWEDFKRIDPIVQLMARVETLEKMAAPIATGDGVILWMKPANLIPPGWVEHTDMRGYSARGLDETQTEFNVVGKTGGSKNKTLSISEMPPHYHHKPGSPFKSFAAGSADYGNSSSQGTSSDSGSNTELAIGNLGSSYNTGGNALEQTVGGGQAFSILDPYRIVIYIKYVG